VSQRGRRGRGGLIRERVEGGFTVCKWIIYPKLLKNL